MARKDGDAKLRQIVSDSGQEFELRKVLAHAILKRGGNDRDFKRLFQSEVADKIAAMVVVESVVSEVLPPDHYRVFVDYAPVPSHGELNGKLFDWASNLYDGREWKAHKTCEGVDETPGERVFLVKNFGFRIKSESVVVWAEANGYRVATLKETLAFAAAQRELQRKFWIVALGSSALHGVCRYVPVLGGHPGERCLGGDWFAGGWSDDGCFLLVRK